MSKEVNEELVAEMVGAVNRGIFSSVVQGVLIYAVAALLMLIAGVRPDLAVSVAVFPGLAILVGKLVVWVMIAATMALALVLSGVADG